MNASQGFVLYIVILIGQFYHLYFKQEICCTSFVMTILVYLLEMSS